LRIDALIDDLVDDGARRRGEPDAETAEDQDIPGDHPGRRQKHANDGSKYQQLNDARLGQRVVVAKLLEQRRALISELVG
jgi:hypothetical protein